MTYLWAILGIAGILYVSGSRIAKWWAEFRKDQYIKHLEKALRELESKEHAAEDAARIAKLKEKYEELKKGPLDRIDDVLR